jgi:hypothetical protein
MKLVKIQREILRNAIDSERRSGLRKPISVASVKSMPEIDLFSKSYATYCKKMQQLLEAGVIARGNELTYAYVVDLDAAETFLQNN